MLILKHFVIIAAVVLAVGSGAGQSRSRPSTKPTPPEETNSLLRMDLLRLPQEEMTPPLRNIFAPGTRANPPQDIALQQAQELAPDDQGGETSALTEGGTTAPPVMTVSLRYIGFIESSVRMIALVVFEGQPIAVVEGEVVGEGIRVGKITREQVEIILPDSSTRLFSLEGE